MEKQARKEMIRMKNEIFKIVTKADAWEKTGRPPISTSWVDIDKTHETGTPMVKSRWVASDFKNPKNKNREDPVNANPPVEKMVHMLSRQMTRRNDGRRRETLSLIHI